MGIDRIITTTLSTPVLASGVETATATTSTIIKDVCKRKQKRNYINK